MALSEIDRSLLERCLARAPRAWEDFVDRFIGLVVHVTNHSAQCRSMRLSSQDREDLCAEVFLAIVRDDFAVLRHFRGQSSLATYLTVVARRVVVRELLRRNSGNGSSKGAIPAGIPSARVIGGDGAQTEQRVSDREEVERLLGKLDGQEATIVRMYHLEGKTYQEISTATGIAENSVGPTLSRARQKMRNHSSPSNSA
ncbi:MAG TPA: sigma-70 family RNA polymerase sigma factor [Pirellulales bacterium]|nr:sigma-70 family RNA polymerase sigma factor [Pirellulales bacterium]